MLLVDIYYDFMDRWNIKMPTIMSGSISVLSDAGLGMAMFSLGIVRSSSYVAYLHGLVKAT